MTADLAELKRLCRASLDAQKIENAGNRELHAEADKLAPLCLRTIILSLIERVARAEAVEPLNAAMPLDADKIDRMARKEQCDAWHERHPNMATEVKHNG